ncbi:MAG: hypothetical protein GQF41_4544 [Candidatus Rifleibacterium amylolyticum]|nr:MAG: hypothetical protein GQF41_4544 [Candidatus Rifleibacterium amylolyticum]
MKNHLIWIAFIMSIFLHIPLSVLPLGRDQGVWATAGMAFNQGAVFFKDFAHFNLPGLGISYALVLKFVEDPRVATMLLSLASSLLIMAGMFFLLRQTLDKAAATSSILLFSLIWPTSQDFWGIAQKDYMAMYGVFLSTWLIARANNNSDSRWLSIYSAGICVALSCMYKPLFVVTGLVLAVFHAVTNLLPQIQSGILNIKDLKRLVVDLVIFLSGHLSIASILLFYLIYNDAFESFYNGIFVIAPAYSSIFRLPTLNLLISLFLRMAILAQPIDWTGIIFFLLWMPIALLSIIYTMKTAFSKKNIWILTPYLVALATFLAQGKAFAYHSYPWQICIIMSVGIWLSALCKKNLTHKRMVYALTAVITTIICARAMFFSQYADTMATWLMIKNRTEYLHSSFGTINPNNGIPAPFVLEQISEWINKNTEARDKILVWGLECQIYALSKRMYATNSPFDFILTGNFTSNVRALKWQDALKKQFIKSLKQEKPKFIIITSNDANSIEPLPSNESAKLIPAFTLFIEKEYCMVLEIYPFEIYKRKI